MTLWRVTIFALITAIAEAVRVKSVPNSIGRACLIYCDGPLLQAIQLSGIYSDSKTFVDMPMKYSPEETLQAFQQISDITNTAALSVFLGNYFLPAGSDVVEWKPTDYSPNPNFLTQMPDSFKYKSWASDLNSLWSTLGRIVTEDAQSSPEKHSFLPRQYPMIVPGGRFRESYYWDSYWIVRGLLVCDMHQSARYVIFNLLDDLKNFGFIPNGGRIYYLDRSHPPLLSEMVLSYYQYCTNKGVCEGLEDFLATSFTLLQGEYKYWMNPTNGHVVTFPDPTIKLNRHYSVFETPRPESYAEDYRDNIKKGGEFFQSVRAGAETGWDFSSRWIGESANSRNNISYIDTIHIVPVDLNSYLFRLEHNLATLSLLTKQDSSLQEKYLSYAIQRSQSIQKVLWDAESALWRDFNLTSMSFSPPSAPSTPSSSPSYYASNYFPLFLGAVSLGEGETNRVLESFERSGLVQEGGLLTSTLQTGQQWDAPNAWPPLVLIAIEGLDRLNNGKAKAIARNLTNIWLETCHVAYQKSGYMYEKYNALEFGTGGGGGEYVPQVGFGWSNAVALLLIEKEAQKL